MSILKSCITHCIIKPKDIKDLIIKPKSVLDHFDYCLEIENATPNTIVHEKKAIVMFLRAYGLNKEELELWAQVLKTSLVVINDDIDFIYPQNVHKFYTYEGFSKIKNYYFVIM